MSAKKESVATEATERELTDVELDGVRGGHDGEAHVNASQQSFAHGWNNGGSAVAYGMSAGNKGRNSGSSR